MPCTFQTVVCLPFQREGYGAELGLQNHPLHQEIRSADLLIAFGGDGTILASGPDGGAAQRPGAGSESGKPRIHVGAGGVDELDRLRDLADWSFDVESRMMLDVSVLRGGKSVNNIALNDAVISKAPLQGLLRLNIFTEEGASSPRWAATALSPAHPPDPPATPWRRRPHRGCPARNLLLTPICPHSHPLLSRYVLSPG